MTNSKGRQGIDSTPLFFWRETEKPFGWLSQWYECSFTHEGVTYSSTEQWMMVQKAALFGDEEIAKQIAATNNPKEQRSLGRKVKGFNEGVWDENKLRIVEEGNYLKFTQSVLSADSRSSGGSATLQSLLLGTGDREIIEASPYDRIWGIGFSAREATLHSTDKWGENLLGKAIMSVRQKLRQNLT